MTRAHRVAGASATFVALVVAGILLWPTSRVQSSAAGPDPTSVPTTVASAPGASASGSPTSEDSPAPEPAGTTATVVAAGDVACDTEDPFLRDGRGTAGHCAQHRTAKLVEELNPDAVLGLGDLQNDDGTLAKFREVYDDSWGRFKDITYPAIGNHEYWSGSPDGYFDYWKQRAGARDKGWYMVRVGEWEIYALNANCAYPFFRSPSCEPGSEQWTWLRDRLRTSEATCQLAMWHEPRFSSGPHGPYGRLEPLWRLLVDARVELVLSAHDETYERFAPLGVGGRRDPEGVRQFVVGTGGDQLYEFDRAQPGSQVRGEGSFGVLELTLEPDAYGWRFRGIGPERVRDAGSAGCLA